MHLNLTSSHKDPLDQSFHHQELSGRNPDEKQQEWQGGAVNVSATRVPLMKLKFIPSRVNYKQK